MFIVYLIHVFRLNHDLTFVIVDATHARDKNYYEADHVLNKESAWEDEEMDKIADSDR